MEFLSAGSVLEESFSNGLLEYPQYTRPEVFMDVKVPEVLLSGHHKNIEEWKNKVARKNKIKKTRFTDRAKIKSSIY